jgi:DNA-binding transcriptional LysR family regulator
MRRSDIKNLDARARALSSRIDLGLLELFDSVYRTRNLSAAAARLGLSQPAVSRGLARLRDAYDDELFVRQQRGVQATPFADHLAEPLGAALAIVRGTVEKPTFDPASDRRLFRISMSDIGERYFLPRMLSHLARVAPGVGVETVSAAMPELVTGLASGEIDQLVGFLPALGKQMHQLKLFHERFIYIAREGHPKVRGRLASEQIRDLLHVIANPPGTPHAATVERMLANPRVRGHVGLRVRSFLSVAPIVAQTDLVAVVPSNLAALVADALRLQLIELPLAIPGFDVSLAWHHRYHRDPAAEWLRSIFVDLFRQRVR